MSGAYTIGHERDDARARIAYLKELLASRYFYCGDGDSICDEIAELKTWLEEQTA